MEYKDLVDNLSKRLEESETEINKIKTLISFCKYKLNISEEEMQPSNVGTSEILIGKVKWVYYIKEYEYKGRTLEQFLITLDNDSKYYMDRNKGTVPQVEDGDSISYKIDGDKLRNVRVLYDV